MIKDLVSGKIERPSPNDFSSGWQTFFKLYKLLRPQICLFIDTTSAIYFNNEISKESDLKGDEVKWYSSTINGAYPKYMKIYLSDNVSTLDFIKHTSMRFSSKAWNEYLNTKISKQLNWLDKELK